VLVFGSFTMSGGEISGNKAVKADDAGGSGGGVYVNPGGSFALEGGTISGNTGTWGGGVQVFGGFTMTKGTISGNKADNYGGGVHVNTGNGGSFAKRGGIIDGTNTAPSGSAVFVWKSSDSSLTRNSAAGRGVNLDSGKLGKAGGWE
jgi:hypothetical protein